MKYTLLTLLLTISSQFCFAQIDDTLMTLSEQRRQQIYNYKIGFITGRIHLTPEQSQSFWPVYNEYDKKKTEIKQKINKVKKDGFNNFTSTDQELNTSVDTFLGLMEQEILLEREYKDKFLKVINIRQLVELYKSEQEFKKLILQKIKEKMGGND